MNRPSIHIYYCFCRNMVATYNALFPCFSWQKQWSW
uniref:Uncharacterized protein n=1 Tax=Medicago truncatula TaxID=3880 RepID=I3S427_MEDTR|nr:unknown [Medicago truncatula]